MKCECAELWELIRQEVSDSRGRVEQRAWHKAQDNVTEERRGEDI